MATRTIGDVIRILLKYDPETTIVIRLHQDNPKNGEGHVDFEMKTPSFFDKEKIIALTPFREYEEDKPIEQYT